MNARMRTGLVGGLLFGSATWAAAELPRHTARPATVPGIPCRPYTSGNAPHPTVTVISLERVPAGPGGGGVADAKRPQVYQLLQPRLQVDHCFLSRVAVTLYEDGRYQISFRADQNPDPGTPDDPRSPLRPGERVQTVLETNSLKRNLFVVKVRGYAAFPVLPEQPNLTTPQPVVLDLPIDPFWVQRGEPCGKLIEGKLSTVARSFDLIDRVEVEFTYR